MVPLNLPPLKVLRRGADHRGPYLLTENVPGERTTLYHGGRLWMQTGAWELVDGPVAVFRLIDSATN